MASSHKKVGVGGLKLGLWVLFGIWVIKYEVAESHLVSVGDIHRCMQGPTKHVRLSFSQTQLMASNLLLFLRKRTPS